MAVFLSPVGGVAAQFFTNTGAVLTGGKLYTYAAGTTTPAATYTSAAGVTFNTNPIILDAAGRVPSSGEIWLTDGTQYKFVLKDVNDVLIASYDNITGINSNFLNFNALEEIQTATAGQTVFTLTNAYTPGTNTLQVFVDGVNQYDGSSYAYTETSSTSVTFTAGLHVGALVKFSTAVTLSAGVTDASLVTYQPAGSGAVATTVQTKLRQTVSVMDFGADPTGTTDSTAAIQAAINNSSFVVIPFGTYRCDSTVVITSSYGTPKNVLSQGATLIRKSASSSNTTPVVQLLGSYGSFNGGNGFVISENNSPSGVVALGQSDATTCNYTAIYWSFSNVNVLGNITAGNANTATTFQSIGVYIPSSQPQLGSSSTNYFGTIENVTVSGVTIGTWLSDLANGHKFVNFQVRGFSHYGYLFQGAYGNTVYGGFMEVNYLDSKIGIGLKTKAYPSAPYASSLQSMYNHIYGITMEFSGTAMQGLVIDVDCQGNYVEFNWNAVGSSILDNDGFNNILESRKQQFTKIASNTITGVGSSAQEIVIQPTAASYAAGYGVCVNSGGSFYPNADNLVQLGTATKRWSQVRSGAYYAADGSVGVSGTFTAGAKTVTVKDGLITSIV
jgi:hypothetical protein